MLRFDHDLFAVPSWVAVLIGQNIVPRGYDTLVDAMDADRVDVAMSQLAAAYRTHAEAMPRHADFIDSLIAPNNRR